MKTTWVNISDIPFTSTDHCPADQTFTDNLQQLAAFSLVQPESDKAKTKRNSKQIPSLTYGVLRISSIWKELGFISYFGLNSYCSII